VVPDGHVQAGEKIEKAFDYSQCETEQEALATIAEKASKSEKAAQTWSILSLVNEALKQNARSNSYQAATLPYRPTEVTPEEIEERMVRDAIRSGKSEAQARKLVRMLLAAEAEEAAESEVPATE
jgi:hypothetical protein